MSRASLLALALSASPLVTLPSRTWTALAPGTRVRMTTSWSVLPVVGTVVAADSDSVRIHPEDASPLPGSPDERRHRPWHRTGAGGWRAGPFPRGPGSADRPGCRCGRRRCHCGGVLPAGCGGFQYDQSGSVCRGGRSGLWRCRGWTGRSHWVGGAQRWLGTGGAGPYPCDVRAAWSGPRALVHVLNAREARIAGRWFPRSVWRPVGIVHRAAPRPSTASLR
jgi:hypothetical protein